MTKDEFIDFYEEHWSDHNLVYNKLVEFLDEQERKIALIKQEVGNNPNMDALDEVCDLKVEIETLKMRLQKCHDRLDEETHKLEN